jgi:eukaryotic-like serine/threonine-protein kinase
MDASEVQAFLESKNLRYKINDSTYSQDVKVNTVLTQHPLPDTKVKENRMIYVTIAAKNPPKVAMPDLITESLSLKGAQLKLKQHDLLLGQVISVPGQTDMVYDQLIGNKPVAPGTMIAKGTRINLKVGNSSGTEIAVPDFTGMSIADAKLMAGEYKVLINIIPDANITEGTITKQKPESEDGVVIRTGETIDVWTE